MVSLSKLMSVDEQGVNFESPHTAEMMSLTPEMSVEIQQVGSVYASCCFLVRIFSVLRRSERTL